MSMEDALNKWLGKTYESSRFHSRVLPPALFTLIGGKGIIADRIAEVIGDVPGNLIDPFLGTGSVPLVIWQNNKIGGRIIAQEASSAIVNAYNVARDNGDTLMGEIRSIYSKYAPIDRDIARDKLAPMYNAGIDDPVKSAAMFIVLSRCAFNSHLQMNKEGKITGGFQSITPRRIFTGELSQSLHDRWLRAVRIIQESKLMVQKATHDSWVDMVRGAGPCDVIYLDPPYEGRGQFKYPGEAEVGVWTEEDTRELIDEALMASRRGVKIVMSNSPQMEKALSDRGFSTSVFTTYGGPNAPPNEVIGVLDKEFRATCVVGKKQEE